MRGTTECCCDETAGWGLLAADVALVEIQEVPLPVSRVKDDVLVTGYGLPKPLVLCGEKPPEASYVLAYRRLFHVQRFCNLPSRHAPLRAIASISPKREGPRGQEMEQIT